MRERRMSASAVNDSPSKRWTKPSQVMKVRLKRQRRSTSDLTGRAKPADAAHDRLASASELAGSSDGARSGKRRNPFGCGRGGSASRRRVQSEAVGAAGVAGEESEPSTGRQRLFSALDSRHDEVFSEEACQRLTATIKSLDSEEEQESAQPQLASEGQPEEKEAVEASGQPYLTADWCLRTRLRFTSQNSFDWCQPIRMKEEAGGLSSFVRVGCASNVQVEVAGMESSWRSQLQQATMYWMHPNLPWLSLFPRIAREPKTFKQSIAIKDPAIGSALMASWSESFRSAFHQLRSGHCPYFYLCAHHYTVLFRGAGLAALPRLHALLTPTTRGLREALKAEGITFSMPLHETSSAPSGREDETSQPQDAPGMQNDGIEQDGNLSSVDATPGSPELIEEDGEKKEQVEAGEDGEEEEEDILRSPTKASSWLQSMGLDRTNFPSLEPSRVKFQTDPLLKLDSRPQSLVLIQGPETQALYNFLLNSRALVAAAGPLAGIPPTILAPRPFQGAALGACKLKSGMMRQLGRGSSLQEMSSLEVSGPILPGHLHALCTLLRSTQEGAFQLAFSNHDATAAFAAAGAAVARGARTTTGSGAEVRGTAPSPGVDTRGAATSPGEDARGVATPSIRVGALGELKLNCNLSDSQADFLSRQFLLDAPIKETVCREGLYS